MNEKRAKFTGRAMREDLHPADNNKSFDEVYGASGIQLTESDEAMIAKFSRMFEGVYAEANGPRIRG